ncbi:hypothetical protein SAY86_017973 [Trapa natans]|uniref:Protein kinase domain-containing protein n=1 Tax=Trapa natans TaxID=22666 RepID=A0AAN7R386_TRANT|nr:hypothetical protein SAY86_017973 [Trapa natans]
MELHLEDNQFTGRITSIDLPKLAFLNVSNNKLQGEIPAALSKFEASSFPGNVGLCGGKLGQECPKGAVEPTPLSDNNGPSRPEKMRQRRKLVLDGAEFDVLAKENAVDNHQPVQNISSGTSTTQGELQDDRLDEGAAEVLGNGGLGSTYKATVVSNGLIVVVKRIREGNGKGKQEFNEEMGKLQHPNILTLAYHFRRDEKLLVSEYVPRGSLHSLLHGGSGLGGPAEDHQGGLERTRLPTLPHGNLKSSNVLLGPDNEPLLTDYGFTQLFDTPTSLQALFAYKAPEAAEHGMVTPKCDIYCLGILILEILTGIFPSQYLHNGNEGTGVIGWVASAVSEGRGAELFDREITNSAIDEMEMLLRIGVACTETNPEQRLNMMETSRRIDMIHGRDGYVNSSIGSSDTIYFSGQQEEDSSVFHVS